MVVNSLFLAQDEKVSHKTIMVKLGSRPYPGRKYQFSMDSGITF